MSEITDILDKARGSWSGVITSTPYPSYVLSQFDEALRLLAAKVEALEKSRVPEVATDGSGPVPRHADHAGSSPATATKPTQPMTPAQERALDEAVAESHHYPAYGHAGDCSVYSAMVNGRPEDGICTCGHGRQRWTNGDYTQMYSEERESWAKDEMLTTKPAPAEKAEWPDIIGGGLSLCLDRYNREQAGLPTVDDVQRIYREAKP